MEVITLMLVKHFIEELREDSGCPFLEDCTKGALRLLENRDWPDNIRGLKNAVQRACINAHEEQTCLSADDFGFLTSDKSQKIEASISDDMTLDDLCKWLISKRLKECLVRFDTHSESSCRNGQKDLIKRNDCHRNIRHIET